MAKQQQQPSFLGRVVRTAGLVALGGIGGAFAIKAWDKHVAKGNNDLRLTPNPLPPAPAPAALPAAPALGYSQPVAAFVTSASPLAPVMPSFFAPPMPIGLPALPQMPVPSDVVHTHVAAQAAPTVAVSKAVEREQRAARKRKEFEDAYRQFLEEEE